MSEQRLEELKKKYQAVLNLIKQSGVQLKNLHVHENKLVLRAEAKTQADSYKVWDLIKLVDADYKNDLMAEIAYLKDQPAEEKAAVKIHKVKAGESLSKIAKEYYGNAQEYTKIFEANRDQLKDPDKIFPGQELKIP